MFAQPRNILRPSFLRMLVDILRFNHRAKQLLARGIEAPTLGALVREGRYSREFREHYLAPMAAAIWSTSPAKTLEFPAYFFIRFFHNHGLLGVGSHLPWRVVRGGSRRYVEALTRAFADRIRPGTRVRRVTRAPEGVTVAPDGGPPERFDHAILALQPFDDYSSYKDEYKPERVRRIPPYWEEGLYQSAYEDDKGVSEDDESNAMSNFFRGLMIGAFISLILWGLIIACLAWIFSQQQPNNHIADFESEKERQEMKALHKYHGTDHAIMGMDGKWYFCRENKMCELWEP